MLKRLRRKRTKKRLKSRIPTSRRALIQDEADKVKTRLFRVNFVYSFVTLSCVGLILRLSYLQISKSIEFRSAALNTSVATIPVLPARGRMYDTNGNLLAYDEPIYSVYYTQIGSVNTTADEIARMAKLLGPAFKTTATSIENLITTNKKYSTVKLFTKITDGQLAFIGENQALLPGVSVEADGIRKYPYGDLAGQVLGYVGSITPEQQNYYVNTKHYQFNQTVGQAGLELQYEHYLQGQIGYQLQQVSAGGNIAGQANYNPAPVAGNNLQLTIDGRLQADAQNAVQQAIQQYQSQSHAQITDGAAVVMDVKTGGVLAMVSYPYLDPNWFITGAFLKHKDYLSTSGAEQDNVIQNPHYPGSTVKPANLLVGLEQGAIGPNTVFNDTSAPLWIGNYPIKEDASYGLVSDIRAIAVSDDKFFYSLGLQLGRWLGSSASYGGAPEGGFANLQHWKNTSFIKGILALDSGEMRFGLGMLTGIDLPWEQSGSFYITDSRYNPAPAVTLNVKQALRQFQQTGQYVNYGSPLDLAFTAFGQMQQFTPMELAQYVTTLADNGKRLQPHLLENVLPPGMYQSLKGVQETPVYSFGAHVQASLNLNLRFLRIVQQGMYAACNETDGTAYPSFGNAPYKAAGKTGTAEIVMNSQKINNSVFIGYAPYNNPQIAVAVMVPGAGFGATTAVPIARSIMDDYFKEHHAPFIPKTQWENSAIPAGWMTSPAYKGPEETH